MSDPVSILHIIIPLRAEGKGDQEVLTRLDKMGVSADDAKAALKKLNEEQDQDNKKTQEATTKKKELTAALKGLAFQFPALARIIALLTNPISVATVALGVLIAKWREWTAAVNESAAAARELATVDSRIASRAEVMAALAAANRDVAKSYNEIVASANSASVAINEETAAMLANQRAAQDIEDSELTKKLEEIQQSGKSDLAKITETQKAHTEARHRKERREIQTAESVAELESKKIANARVERRKAEEQMPEDQEIARQNHAAGPLCRASQNA